MTPAKTLKLSCNQRRIHIVTLKLETKKIKQTKELGNKKKLFLAPDFIRPAKSNKLMSRMVSR